MTLPLTYGETVALAALLSLSRTPLAARLVARLDGLIGEARQTPVTTEETRNEVLE